MRSKSRWMSTLFAISLQRLEEAGVMKRSRKMRWVSVTAGALLSSALITGCGMQGTGTVAARLGSPAAQGKTISAGSVHGGQQPVTGATIQLWGVGTSGYGSSATPLLTASVTTSDGTGVGGNASNAFNSLPAGNFNITGDYSCPQSNMVYLTATGGNPGMAAATNNANLAVMISLGSCSDLLAHAGTTFINLNELTTVAAVWPLARFMSSYSAVGSPQMNTAGLMSALAAANKLVSTATGSAPGPALPAGATLPVSEMNTLANVLAACVNSAGGTANDGTNCGKLFSYATQGSNVPTDTIGAALNIARNPAANVASIFGLTGADVPFQPVLSGAPDNWLIGITYIGGGLNAPNSLAIDSDGSLWLTNPTANTVSKLDNTGAALSGAGGYNAGGSLATPSSVAIDLAGHAWIANKSGNNVVEISSTGSLLGSFDGSAAISSPTGIAIDGLGNAWVANSGNSTVTKLDNSGNLVGNYGSGAGVTMPTAIAINAH